MVQVTGDAAGSATIDVATVLQAVRQFSVACSRYALREDDYTRRLAGVLADYFPGEILMAMGGLATQLQHYWGEESHRLKAYYLPKGQDIYPDITLVHPVHDRTPLDLTRFESLHADSRVLALFECKYTRSFPSATRRHFLQDAAKLEILGDYCRGRFGTWPLLIQFIFVFGEGSWPERLRGWYADEAVRADLPHVQVFMVDASGDGEAIKPI